MAFVNPEHIVAQLEIEPGMEVADFGAGTGFYTILFSQLVGAEGKVYAVEIQPELLTKARGMASGVLDNVEFLQGDVEQSEGSHIARDSVDVVLASNILFQAENKEAVLQEAFRVLKRGGRLVVVDWIDSFGGLGPQPEQVISQESVTTLAESLGFRVEGELDADTHHWGVIFGK